MNKKLVEYKYIEIGVGDLIIGKSILGKSILGDFYNLVTKVYDNELFPPESRKRIVTMGGRYGRTEERAVVSWQISLVNGMATLHKAKKQ